MKQVLQHLSNGVTEVAEVPRPVVSAGQVLVATRVSVVSSGTERMLVDFGKASLVGKAMAQPAKVRQVLDKVGTDGVLATMDAVKRKLDQPLPLGYSQVGTVVEIGAGVEGCRVGDRVVSNGPHAELAAVPHRLCCRVPDGVSDEDAAYAVLAAISLQGARLAVPTAGECAVVSGLGVLGLLAVQILLAHGCRVMGVDPNPARTARARALGADVVTLDAATDPVEAARVFSRGRGVDFVLLTAATDSNTPVQQAATMCRKRGRIVLVGVTGLTLSRADFYEKELSFQVSCSYGPGRYDPAYEQAGHDYPIGFVRWTEQRNFEAVLDLMAAGRLTPSQLTTDRVSIDQAPEAYARLDDGAALGIVLEYPRADVAPTLPQSLDLTGGAPARRAEAGAAGLAWIGAGSYASSVLIPAFAATPARLRLVVTRQGVAGSDAARRFGFERVSSDLSEAWKDAAVSAVVISTRHDSHARLTMDALRAGRHVFVEKPLALELGHVDDIERLLEASSAAPVLMVGFNRRFAPLVQRLRDRLATVAGPRSFIMTVNAGEVPAGHWTLDPAVGGGRILGEGCHFIDLLRHLAGVPIVSAQAHPGAAGSATLMLQFADGSLGAVHYLTTGHRRFPKERLEVFAGGRIYQLDNFRILRGFGDPGLSVVRAWRQDKGQRACAAAFVQAITTGGPSPIPLAELCEVSRVTIRLAREALG